MTKVIIDKNEYEYITYREYYKFTLNCLIRILYAEKRLII